MIKFVFLIVFNTFLLFSNECTFHIVKNSDLDYLNRIGCTTINIKFASGTFHLKSEISIDRDKIESIVISGNGIGNTKIYVENSIGFIDIQLKRRTTVVKIQNLSIYAKDKKIKNAILISQPAGGNQHKRNVVLRYIEISNYKNKGEYFFLNAVLLHGSWRPLIDNVFITGFFGPKLHLDNLNMNTCINLHDVYSPTVTNSRCWSCKIGLNIVSDLNPGPEGMMIDHSKFVETMIGINIALASKEPGGFITNNHINSVKNGIKIINKKFLIIENNLMYRHKGSKSYTDMNLNSVSNSIIVNNIFHYPSNSKNRKRQEISLLHSMNNIISNNLVTQNSKIVFGDIEKNKVYNNFILSE